MNEIHKGRVTNIEKPFPGCLGRVVNLLDYGPKMATNRLLTDRAHSDGLVHKAVGSTRDWSQEKTMPNELRSNGTPMKMLIAHEMSKEVETKQKPANLVAKLMGLDALPEQQPNQMSQISQAKGQLQSPLSRPSTPPRFLKHEGGFHDKQIHNRCRSFQDHQEYKDVYEVWQQSPKGSFVQHKSPEKRYNEKTNVRGMELIREKFNEAKRLATDENLRQSKEFQDALEVLSSNKELFLKFLQEPNSLFSQQLYELQSLPSAPHTKRITLLRPSKSLGNNTFIGYEETKQKAMQDRSQSLEEDIWEKNQIRSNSFSNQKNDNVNHPTRIVVLKPSPRKTQEVATVTSSPTSEHHHREGYFEDLENEEAQSSREVAKEITQQMHETLSSYQVEDAFLSSVFSNGYVGDESSFNRSDNDYVGEGNFSDSEVMTPTSRVSWDYANKFGSPFSSSFSRASYSPESSVCREAKKRLSERWAMMASNGNGEEQQNIRRSSSTLGEMLALTETKKPLRPNHEGIREANVSTSRSYGGEQDFRGSTSFLLDSEKNEGVEFVSPKNLLRSRSVPVSSTTYGSRLNVEVPDLDVSKSKVPNGVEKSKSVKSSLKGKVSNLFFSRNKKRSKDKSAAAPLGSMHNKSSTVETLKELEVNASVRTYEDNSQCVTDCCIEEGPFQRFGAGLNSSALSPSTCTEQKQGRTFLEVLSMDKSTKARCSSENQNLNQPSPVSVLEALFEEENAIPQPSGSVKTDLQGSLLDHRSLQSNLISKSPRIESLARSLSWDDASDLATSVHSKYSVFPSIADDEQEWLLFIRKLLSSAGTSGGELSYATISRRHSPECPLDPKLLEKLVDLEEDQFQWHETGYRQRRLNQKLVFDSVNEALVDITRYKSNASLWRRCSNATLPEPSTSDSETLVTAEDIWNRLKEWFSGETTCFSGENGDNNSLVVERVVKMEVVGRGWVENMKLEVDGIGKEIEEKVLEDLVEDALFELAGRIR